MIMIKIFKEFKQKSILVYSKKYFINIFQITQEEITLLIN